MCNPISKFEKKKWRPLLLLTAAHEDLRLMTITICRHRAFLPRFGNVLHFSSSKNKKIHATDPEDFSTRSFFFSEKEICIYTVLLRS